MRPSKLRGLSSQVQLGSETSLAEVRATAVAAGNKVCVEYGTWKAAEDHHKTCEQMAQWTFESDDVRHAVRQALEKLPVGSPRAKMEHARDAALAPFRAAKKAARDANLYLLHASGYIEKLGDEETGEWDLGDWSERRRLAEKLKAKLRPVLIQKLLEETLNADEASDFIEDWVYRELELDD